MQPFQDLVLSKRVSSWILTNKTNYVTNMNIANNQQPVSQYIHQNLYNDQPLIVSPVLAKLIGLNKAIILQQVHYWLKKNMSIPERKETHFINGRWWSYNSMLEWQEEFPFWSLKTIQRTITELEKEGILISDNFNKDPFNKTKWYSINYHSIPTDQVDDDQSTPIVNNHDNFCEEVNLEQVSEENYMSNRLGQIVPIEQVNLSLSYTETNNTYKEREGVNGSNKSETLDIEITDKLKSEIVTDYQNRHKVTLTDWHIEDGLKGFRYFHIGKGSKFQDCEAAFKNWMRYYQPPTNRKKSDNTTKETPVTAEKSLLSQILQKLFQVKGSNIIHEGILNGLQVVKLDSDCVHLHLFSKRLTPSQHQQYQELIGSAVRSLKPKVTNIKFL